MQAISHIVLIQPPSTLQRLQRLKSRRPELEAPLPFVYIAPYVLDAGFSVEVVDLRIDNLAALRRTLQETRPLITGISVMPGSMLRDAIAVTRLVKSQSPATRVVWGGTFPTLHDDICLQVRDLDFVVCGDGEITLTELAAALRDSRPIEAVDGLAYMCGGALRRTSPRQPVDLDRRPVGAWHLLDRYMPHYLGPSGLLSINTARGCPYRCTFCYNTAIYPGFNRYRTRSIEGVLEEVEHLVSRYRPRALLFMDDDFLANRKRGTELLTVLHERFPHLRYRIDARADELSDASAVAHLAVQGVESVFLGVEGVSGEFLGRIRKGQDTHTTFEAATACAANRITATYSFTCGYPDETYRDLYDRVDMASALRTLHPRSRCQIEIVSPVIGTPLYAELDRSQLMPAKTPEAWAYFSDWKSAAAKAWIADAQFYEAFQLAFYLAFSVRAGLDGGPRLVSTFLSRWSRARLDGRRPTKLPEYRAGNYLLKKVIWGRSP